MCYQMNRLFPGASNAKECLTQAAQTFEAIARLDLAARVLLNLADLEPEKKDHWREVATDFFALSGNRESKERAIQMFVKLAEEKAGKPKTRDQAAPILEKAFQLSKELKDTKLISSVRVKIEQLGVEPATSRFTVEEAEAAYKAGDATKAFNLARRVVGREAQLKDAKDVAARARFLQARILEDEYRRQSVKARVDRIGLVLAIKTEKLEKAQRAYQSAARMGDTGVAIESYGRLADIYIDYAHAVKGMKLPDDVPESDQKVFYGEIEQIAMPMEEKGIEALGQAIEAARKSARLDGMAGDLQQKMDRLNMKSEVTPKVEVEPLPPVVPGFTWRVLGFVGHERGGAR
jgi:tetratricopeptide (TPR) repeat protein